MLKFSGVLVWRLGSRATGNLVKYSSSSATILKADKLDVGGNSLEKSIRDGPAEEDSQTGKTGLVAAVFASLNNPDDAMPERKPSPKSVKPNRFLQIDAEIAKAQDINSLLKVAENTVVSRKHALKIVSMLSEWASSNKVAIADFEKDHRFLKLCRILARTPSSHALTAMTHAEDLSTVLGITGDDEAARLIGNLTLAQMIKVMKTLCHKGRRSTSLLRALSHNITSQPEPLGLKKSSDLLYAMSVLNFPESVLMDRICHDVLEDLSTNADKPSLVTSVGTSLGILRYRETQLLDAIVQWVTEHKQVCRAQDIASCVTTLGAIGYLPVHSDGLIESALLIKEEDLIKPTAWLDLVFSLLTLEKATETHLKSTMHPDFIDKLLSTGEIAIPIRRKLMTINGYMSLVMPKNDVPRLPEIVTLGVPIVYTKEKTLYVQSIMDTFRSLVSSENFLKKNCNSDMGFLYDAEFAVDAKCHPVSLERAAKDKRVHRIAVLGLDYHDMCRKTPEPLGLVQLYTRILQLKGFKVLQIPYTQFNTKDKLINRVQYIESRLKEVIGNTS